MLALVALLASCASQPPRRDETAAILEIRDDYLRTNPNGRFNGEIERGEVAVGMGYYDVLAAWGMPDSRVADAEHDEEWWTYVIASDNEIDWIRYDFLFAKKVVAEWEMTRNVGSGSTPFGDDARGISTRVPPTPAPSLGEGVRKGGAGSMKP
jgi:hypothetical protein